MLTNGLTGTAEATATTATDSQVLRHMGQTEPAGQSFCYPGPMTDNGGRLPTRSDVGAPGRCLYLRARRKHAVSRASRLTICLGGTSLKRLRSAAIPGLPSPPRPRS